MSAKTDAFEQGMRKTTATLKFTEQQAAQVANALGGLGNALTQVGGKAKQTSGIMSDLKGNLLGLAAGVVSFQALRAGIESSVQAALKLEALTTAFKVITGSAKGASDAMAFVRETAEQLGVQVGDLATSYKTLLAATEGTRLSLKDTQTLFLGITEAGRAMSLSSEDIAGAIRPIGQILNQQAIQGDEWRNEFGSRIPKAMQLLLEATNGAVKTQQELTKAMEEGKLKGDVVFDIMSNLGQLLRNKYAPAAMEAARGTQAAFERLQTAVTELQAAIGQGLAPALAEAARALTAFIQLGREGAGAFGGQFIGVIREATSVVIGLSGAVVVLGKYMAALGAGIAFGPEAWKAGWEDVQQTFTDIIALQNKVLQGGFAAAPGAQVAAPQAVLKPVTLGGGTNGKTAPKTAAERESERLGERQNDIIKEITDGLAAQELVLERGIALERVRLEQRLQAAGFAAKDAEALLYAYDETEKLKQVNEDHLRNKAELVSVQAELQKALDKELYTERELLRQRLVSLGADETKMAHILTLYDRQVTAEKERLAAAQAVEDSLRAQADHIEKMAGLHKQLEPRLRLSRRQELIATQQEMVQEGATEFELAASDVQLQTTLIAEEWDRMVTAFDNGMSRIGDELSNTFIDMATTGEFSFKRLADSLGRATIEMLADILDLKTAIAEWLKGGLQAAGGGQGGWFQGLLGGMGGGGAGNAALQTDISTSMAASPELFGFGGGMAAGGPVMPGKFYTVGERGPETLVAGGPGHIIPNGGGQTFNMTVITPDANSFRLSERQIAAQSARMLAHARRNL